MGENHFAPMPVAVYGMGLLMNAIAYTILVRTLLGSHGPDSDFAQRIGADVKGYISLALYILAVGLSFVNSWFSLALFAIVALIWFIPDRRFERPADRGPRITRPT